MSRPRKLVATLLRHKPTGQAKVRIEGRDVYLGKWGSKQAREAYSRLCGELATGGLVATSLRSTSLTRSSGPTVSEVFAAWLAWAKGHYVKNGRPTGELFAFGAPIQAARKLYGSIPAANFGPLALESVRIELSKPSIHKGHGGKPVQRSRSVVNRYARKLVSVFRWAAARELIPGSAQSIDGNTR